MRIIKHIFNKNWKKVLYLPRIIFSCCIPIKYWFKVDFPHPVGIVIGGDVEIGNNVIIYQNTTIGGKKNNKVNKMPKIEDNVIIYKGCLIINDIKEGSIIKAHSIIK